MQKIKFLTIDGGGVRGIIPLTILAEIEKKHKISINNTFDYMSGSSTGALIVGMLRMGVSAQEVLDIYMTQIPKIFEKKFLRWGIFRPKYDDCVLNSMIDLYMNGESLGYLQKNTMFPIYNWSQQKLQFYKSWENNDKLDTYLADILRASASAQSFFKPWEINGDIHIDSGNIINNPSLSLYIDIAHKHPERKIQGLSMSTGNWKLENRVKMGGGGKLFWASRTVNGNLNQQARYTNYIASKMASDRGEFFFRANPDIIQGSTKIDDGNVENLKNLQKDAKKYFDKNETYILASLT